MRGTRLAMATLALSACTAALPRHPAPPMCTVRSVQPVYDGGVTATYVLDDAGRLESRHTRSSRSVTVGHGDWEDRIADYSNSWRYDAAGHPIEHRATSEFTRSNWGRSETSSGGTSVVRRTYGADGRVLVQTSKSRRCTFTYDARGQITAVTSHDVRGELGYRLAILYPGRDEQTEFPAEPPHTHTIALRLDDAGLVIGYEFMGGDAKKRALHVETFVRDAAGRLESDGKRRYERDGQGRLVRTVVIGNDSVESEITYDDTGRPTRVVERVMTELPEYWEGDQRPEWPQYVSRTTTFSYDDCARFPAAGVAAIVDQHVEPYTRIDSVCEM